MAILSTETELLVELSTCSFGQSIDGALPEDPISPSKGLGLQVGHYRHPVFMWVLETHSLGLT